ncbi:MAG: hypothetical protein ACYS76_15330 [Planctomycetota bacterium]|jgi:hypothetical protein
MRRLGILSGIIVFAFFAANAEAKEENQIRVQIQIFKLTDIYPSRTFADEKIWTTDEPPEKLKNKVTVFSRGWFELGKDKLEFKKGRCFWNKTEIPITDPKKLNLPEDEIRWVGSPEIVMRERGAGSFKVESQQPIQYFEKRADGLFELKEVELPTGLDIEITEADESRKHGHIMLTDIIIRMRSVERREKVEGANLPIGFPILGEQKYVFYFRLRPGKDYGILIRPEHGQGGLLLRLRTSSTFSGTLPKTAGKTSKKDDTSGDGSAEPKGSRDAGVTEI